MKNILLFRKGVIFVSLFLLFSAVSYGQYSVSVSSISPASPATLICGQNVSVNFSYTKASGNVRIFARPMYNGNLAANYSASGSPLYINNSGSGNGTFTLTTPGNVDQIRFQIVDANTGAVLYQTFYNVYYAFVNYRIYNISVSPASPATLISGQNVSVSFSYQKISGSVRIFARPFNNGNLAPNYAASGSPLYTANIGSGSGTFTLTSPGNVDSIRFQVVDATTNVVLFQTFYAVNYTYVNYLISGISVSPASPAIRLCGQNVSVSFNYRKISGNVRIFARPFYNGNLAPNYAASGSPLYSANAGAGSGTFTLTSPGNVDSIRIQIIDANTGAVLYQTFHAVNYTFVNYRIYNISVSHGSPSTIITGQNVSVSFSYQKTGGSIRIFARPMNGGSLAPNYAASGSPLYTAASGAGNGTFTLLSPGHVDQIRFQIVDATTYAVLYETFVGVDYTFVNSLRSGDEEEPLTNAPAAVSLEVAPVPADEELTLTTGLETFTYRISDMAGASVKTGTSDSYSQTLNVNDLPAGMYILQIQNGDIIREKKIVIK